MGGDKPAGGADDGWTPHTLPSFVEEGRHLVGVRETARCCRAVVL